MTLQSNQKNKKQLHSNGIDIETRKYQVSPVFKILTLTYCLNSCFPSQRDQFIITVYFMPLFTNETSLGLGTNLEETNLNKNLIVYFYQYKDC